MQVTYRNNFKKIKELFALNCAKIGIVNLRAYPFHELRTVHPHTDFSLSPWSATYASPLNHVCLYDVADLRQLVAFPYFLVRDGYLPLIDFFFRFPVPEKFYGMLLVHTLFQDLVPSAWSSKVLFYDFERMGQDHFSDTTECLIIKGLVMNGVYDYSSFVGCLEKSLKLKNLKRIIFSMQTRQNYFLKEEWDGDAYFVEFANKVVPAIYSDDYKKFDKSFIGWKDFYLQRSFCNTSFIDFNKKDSLFIDDHSDFFLMGQGCLSLQENDQKNRFSVEDIYVPLSHHHGIRIIVNPRERKNNQYKEIKKILGLCGDVEGKRLTQEGFSLVNGYISDYLATLNSF